MAALVGVQFHTGMNVDPELIEQDRQRRRCEAERAKAGEAAASEHAASELAAPVKPTHKVQGCDSKCDWPCSKCGWEECTIHADHGSSCDARIFSDGEVVHHILKRSIKEIGELEAEQTHRASRASRSRAS